MDYANTLKRIEIALFNAILFTGTFLIFWESRDYFLPGRAHAFLLERLELSTENWWRYSLLAHITGGR